MSRFALFCCWLCIVTSATAQTKKLDYRQVKDLKDATGYLDEVENLLLNLDDRFSKNKPGDASVQDSFIRSWVEWNDRCVTLISYSDNRFKQLPQDHPDVAAQVKRRNEYAQKVDSNKTTLEQFKKGVGAVLEKGEGKEFETDFARLKEINQMFYDAQMFNTHPERAVATCKLMAPAKAERDRLVQKYADLLKQDSSKQMREVVAYFDQVFPRFEQTARQYAAEAPRNIDENLNEAKTMGKQAVENKNPLYFKPDGGVNQRIGWAETRYEILAAIAPDGSATKQSRANIDAAKVEIRQMAESLNDAIVAGNTPPAESYNGPDRSELVAMVNDKWKASGNNAQVLKSGINSDGWQRETRWDWSSTGKYWEKVDKSRIQGFVIVQLDGNTAAIYYVNLVKNHLNNDRIEAWYFNDPREPVQVQNKLLLSQVK